MQRRKLLKVAAAGTITSGIATSTVQAKEDTNKDSDCGFVAYEGPEGKIVFPSKDQISITNADSMDDYNELKEKLPELYDNLSEEEMEKIEENSCESSDGGISIMSSGSTASNIACTTPDQDDYGVCAEVDVDVSVDGSTATFNGSLSGHYHESGTNVNLDKLELVPYFQIRYDSLSSTSGISVSNEVGASYEITRDDNVAIFELSSMTFDDPSDSVHYNIDDVSAEYDDCIRGVSTGTRLLYKDENDVGGVVESGESLDLSTCTDSSSVASWLIENTTVELTLARYV